MLNWKHRDRSTIFLPSGATHSTDRGAEQGDPLGGIEAASALLGALDAAKVELDSLNIRFFDVWYLDDGQIICQAGEADVILRVIDKHLAKIGASRARGENIKSVARFYGVSDLSQHMFDYTRDTCKVHVDQDGTFSHVLGIEIDVARGETSPFDTQFSAVATKAGELQNRLKELQDSPSEFTLLKNCASVCKVVHLMRAAGPYISLGTLQSFDSSVTDSIGHLLGQQLDDEAKLQIGLPTKQGGLGLYRAESMAFAAFIASRTEVAPLVMHLIDAFEILFSDGDSMKQIFEDELDNATASFMLQLEPNGRILAREKINMAVIDAKQRYDALLNGTPLPESTLRSDQECLLQPAGQEDSENFDDGRLQGVLFEIIGTTSLQKLGRDMASKERWSCMQRMRELRDPHTLHE